MARQAVEHNKIIAAYFQVFSKRTKHMAGYMELLVFEQGSGGQCLFDDDYIFVVE
jgi:hypothetical protein